MFPFYRNVENFCCLYRTNLWAADMYFKCYDNLLKNSAKNAIASGEFRWPGIKRYPLALATITNAGRSIRSCN